MVRTITKDHPSYAKAIKTLAGVSGQKQTTCPERLSVKWIKSLTDDEILNLSEKDLARVYHTLYQSTYLLYKKYGKGAVMYGLAGTKEEYNTYLTFRKVRDVCGKKTPTTPKHFNFTKGNEYNEALRVLNLWFTKESEWTAEDIAFYNRVHVE